MQTGIIFSALKSMQEVIQQMLDWLGRFKKPALHEAPPGPGTISFPGLPPRSRSCSAHAEVARGHWMGRMLSYSPRGWNRWSLCKSSLGHSCSKAVQTIVKFGLKGMPMDEVNTATKLDSQKADKIHC